MEVEGFVVSVLLSTFLDLKRLGAVSRNLCVFPSSISEGKNNLAAKGALIACQSVVHLVVLCCCVAKGPGKVMIPLCLKSTRFDRKRKGGRENHPSQHRPRVESGGFPFLRWETRVINGKGPSINDVTQNFPTF